MIGDDCDTIYHNRPIYARPFLQFPPLLRNLVIVLIAFNELALEESALNLSDATKKLSLLFLCIEQRFLIDVDVFSSIMRRHHLFLQLHIPYSFPLS
jgi:hypothetical protein